MNTLKNALKAQYSQIPNDLIIDMNLSSNALRVLLYLFTKPDNWNVYNSDICKQLNISEKSLTKYWKELLNSRWLRRTKKQSSSGKFTGGYLYHIGNFSISEKSSVSVKSGEYNNNIPLQQKETINNNKKINKKESLDLILKDFDLSSINMVSLNEWLVYKNFNYKKIGISKIIKMLNDYSFDIQKQIIDTSIMNGWKGLFPPKGFNQNQNRDIDFSTGNIFDRIDNGEYD